MTDQEIIRAIGTHLDWTYIEEWQGRLYGVRPGDDNPAYKHMLPNYPNDLNAVAPVEATLSDDEFMVYQIHLPGTQNGETKYQRERICATARQRSEALVRVFGLWKE
jgi:hypothetical protein